MKQSWLMKNQGPYVIFGVFLYPVHSSARENYVARKTISGNESIIGLLEPIPLRDIEENDLFSQREECSQYLDALILGSGSGSPSSFRDRIDSVEFIIMTIPFLKPGLDASLEDIALAIMGEKEFNAFDPSKFERFVQQKEEETELTGITVEPEAAVRDAAFPGGLFPPRDSSLLIRALNYNAVYVSNSWAHVLRTSPREGSDRIHLNGKDFFWSRKFELPWIEEDYLSLIHARLRSGLKEKVSELLAAYSGISQEKKNYAQIAELGSFEFQNIKARWMGGKCYLTIEKGPFARQDYEYANKWHPREGFEIGGAFYYSNGRLYFKESPVVIAGYKDVAFYSSPLGIFRELCSRDKNQWEKYPKTPEGAAGLIRGALDIFYNGFSPESVREHIGGFGDGKTYREICPLEKAFTANSLDEVRSKGFEPVGVHMQLK